MNRTTVEELKALLRDRQLEEAIVRINNAIEPIQAYLDKSSEKNQEAVLQLVKIMSGLEDAIKCKDMVLLCDIIEYELYPFMVAYIK